MAGVHVSSGLKVVYIILAAAIQAVMPYLGHATMVKVLRALIIPFGAIFVLLAVYDFKHGSAASRDSGADGSSTPRDSPSSSPSRVLAGPSAATTTRATSRATPSKGSIVGWMFLGTAIPEIFMMVLGAATFTFSHRAPVAAWNGANPFEALHSQHYIPSWVVVLFLIFAIVQLFGINSLDLYSSGVSLQAMGLRLKRYQAVVLDSVLACGLTI